MEGFSQLNVLVPQRSTSSIHPLHPSRHDTIYHVVLSVDNKLGSKIVTVRSPLSVCNHTAHALSLYYQKSALTSIGENLIGDTVNPFDDLVRVAVIEPNETYSVPLFVAYHCKLFIHPSYMENCRVSEACIWWRDFKDNARQEIYCLDKENAEQVMFSLSAIATKIQDDNNDEANVPSYLIKLMAPIRVHNFLPLSIELLLPTTNRQLRIENGAAADVYELGTSTIKKVEIKVRFSTSCKSIHEN
jgi:vacuolar protein sorting-associated protein 13A/C